MKFETRNGKHVWISAVNAKPQNIDQVFASVAEKHPAVSIQLVDLDKVPGGRYLSLATVNAIQSFQSKHPIGKTLGMELLLYIAGEKQINEAIKRVGITAQTRRVAILAIGEPDEMQAVTSLLEEMLGRASENQLLDDWTEERTENVRAGFRISAKEIRAIIRKGEPVHAAMERLAIERSALLAARK